MCWHLPPVVHTCFLRSNGVLNQSHASQHPFQLRWVAASYDIYLMGKVLQLVYFVWIPWNLRKFTDDLGAFVGRSLLLRLMVVPWSWSMETREHTHQEKSQQAYICVIIRRSTRAVRLEGTCWLGRRVLYAPLVENIMVWLRNALTMTMLDVMWVNSTSECHWPSYLIWSQHHLTRNYLVIGYLYSSWILSRTWRS